MRTERVYAIGSPGSRLVKIGRAVNVGRRLASIQRMSPAPLEVLWTTAGGADLEGAFHAYFSGRRTHGEWFDFGDQDPVAVITANLATVEADAARRTARRESPYPPRAALPPAETRAVASIEEIADAQNRAQAAIDVTQEMRRIRCGAFAELKKDRTFAEIGKMFGISGSRVDQIIRGE